MAEIIGVGRSKREKIIILTYSFIALIVILVLIFLNIKTELIEGRIFYSLDLWLLMGAFIALLFPFAHISIITVKKLLKLYEEQLRYPLVGFLSALILLLLSNYWVLFLLELRVISYFFLMGALITLLIVNVKYSNFLIQLEIRFAFKKLYIIRNSGQPIYAQVFEASPPGTKEKRMISYLVGGFIYAITHGIKEVIKQDYETSLRSMDFGRIKMIFCYGEKVFGVLFTREVNDVIYDKLRKFTDQFEITFKEDLERTGDKAWLTDQARDSKEEALIKKADELLKSYFKY
ncbi:MAG: hypothetical protein HWN66_14455 [Candidatus Helarchaeota archaeon]|nr:hypothetical protein [Candidatus Helarchaeota archaeon]